MLVLSLIAMMALPVILFYMNRWIIRPVRKLNDAMEEISRGNMDYRIEEESSGSEFERMNREFNRMMEEVSSLKINVYEELFPSPLGDPYIQILSSSPRINPIIFTPLAAQTKLAPQEALNPSKKSRFC